MGERSNEKFLEKKGSKAISRERVKSEIRKKIKGKWIKRKIEV